ncbi:two-component system sensor histidine kinase CreC [Hydrogenophaga aromaticivorans]|uniref:two-component system sensor histidine kinase CreC n=1 Tax=Hydrogenophaga aromaticivorans TaxID=2610898 RepID=UPI001B36CF80|nr:two-component system sensor histidine kinase CreC [Hydrogenophaga aromaticivorans]MBQ0917890.1 two-component system sensor histidine kinase CreC [Hydrogenophaga aromaticivorans]
MRIGLRLLLGFFLVLGLALFVVLRIFLEEVKPGTRLAMEDSLVDAAYALAQLAAPDMKAGTIATGGFAQAMTALPLLKPNANIWGFQKNQIHTRITVTDARGTVVFDSRGQDLGQDHSRWNDVYKTLRGEYGARSSGENPGDTDQTVMHVAAPIRDGERIIGVLTVARPNHTLEPYIQRSRDRILHWSWGLLGISLAIGLLFTWWMASSLSRLRGYANAVARGERAELPRMGRLSGNTEFSDLAQAVERMRLKLEDKAYVENYVHTLTHELKSPLAAIRGAAELLQEPLPDAERERFAANIERQTERLQQLIDRLLALADVEQMRGLDAVEPVDLAALTRELMHIAEPRTRRKGLRMIDELGEGGVVQGNRFLIAQALQNLLDNAIDFSPQGGALTLRLQRGGDRLNWSVRDQGPGVPDYAMGRIFERFYSLPRSDTQDKSSGLGLCLVKEVSDLHGGEVRVENVESPRGCLATWRLPA